MGLGKRRVVLSLGGNVNLIRREYQGKSIRIHIDRYGNRSMEIVEITANPKKTEAPKRDLLETIYLCSMSALGFFVSWYMLH